MGMDEIEEPLLTDVENRNPDSGAQASNGEGVAVNRARNSWSAVLPISMCCIAAILFVSAGVVSYNTSVQLHKMQLLGEDIKVGPHDNSAKKGLHRPTPAEKASRSLFHFQPEENWMNDPNAPMYYGGFYHFFYQYNPNEAVFGNISWGHAVSSDLIHWMYLEVALYPDQWYDIEGVWSGSATILKDGTPAILYTGGSMDADGNMIQSQALALPVDPRDPLLREWYKPATNPILLPPGGFKGEDFRDPTTAWLEDDGYWRLAIGTKLDQDDGSMDGMALLYQSRDFINWELQETTLHDVPGTGMWECVDFFPVTTQPENQLENSASLKAQNEFGLQHHAAIKAESYVSSFKYVLKASLDSWTNDHYTIGTYSTETHRFTVDDATLDIGIGFQYDYGKFYASKTFYDSSTGRRIVWSWVNESDTTKDDTQKGWASIQAIPRTIWLDNMTEKNLLTWPVQEVESLRGAKANLQDIMLEEGDVMKVDGADGAQLDILISFEKPNVSAVDNKIGNRNPKGFDCSQGGSAQKGVFGPFGVLVLTDDAMTEQTAVFFYMVPVENGRWSTQVCNDQSRSSLSKGIDETVYGSFVTVLPSEDEIIMRILVDHSVIETFAMGGRMAITSRVYPTKALNENSRLFLFNNGTTPVKLKNLDVYQMTDVNMFAI